MNINYFFTIENRVYVKRTFFFISIQQLKTSLLIQEIENNIHNFNKYIVANLFINNHVVINEKKTSTTNRFLIEIHIVDELKINFFINNNVLNAQQILLNLKTQITTLTNCRNLEIFINIIAKKNVDQKRIIRSKNNFKILIEVIV